MIDIGLPSPSVKGTDGSGCHDPSISETVRMGREAMARKRRGWADWIAIGQAVLIGRAAVMRDTNTNKPVGRRYERAMADWLVANGFKEIDKRVRSRLLECLQHRDEIDQWLSGLTEGERFRFNHPDTVLRKWKRSNVVADTKAAPRPPSAVAKLKEANVDLQERLHRAEREIAGRGGDLWSPHDTPDSIAKVMVEHLPRSKAERVAQQMLQMLKDQKAGCR